MLAKVYIFLFNVTGGFVGSIECVNEITFEREIKRFTEVGFVLEFRVLNDVGTLVEVTRDQAKALLEIAG